MALAISCIVGYYVMRGIWREGEREVGLVGVATVYIGYIHLIQLIQMNGCSVAPPHRDLIQLFKIFKKFFKNFSLQPPQNFFQIFCKNLQKTLDKFSALCYNVSTINQTTTKQQISSERRALPRGALHQSPPPQCDDP